jgi:hypothetical protein
MVREKPPAFQFKENIPGVQFFKTLRFFPFIGMHVFHVFLVFFVLNCTMCMYKEIKVPTHVR